MGGIVAHNPLLRAATHLRFLSGVTRRTASIFLLVITLMVAIGVTTAARAADPIDAGSQWLWRSPKPAAPARRPSASGDANAAAYERCLAQAKADPAGARATAEAWQKRGGAHPADHCYAVALIGLKQYKEGATRLEKLQQEMVHAPAALRAEVLDQAAQAWLLAGDPGRAYSASTGALGMRPNDPDLLLDRAEAAGAAGWYDKALADLDAVLAANPSRTDALVFRASAHRALNQLDQALADTNKALSLVPDSASALLERGYISAFRGDAAGAVKDWERVIAVAPRSSDAATAKANLARLQAAAANDSGKPIEGNKRRQ
jgi:tetratricopeptide (TPR) repeat protein